MFFRLYGYAKGLGRYLLKRYFYRYVSRYRMPNFGGIGACRRYPRPAFYHEARSGSCLKEYGFPLLDGSARADFGTADHRFEHSVCRCTFYAKGYLALGRRRRGRTCFFKAHRYAYRFANFKRIGILRAVYDLAVYLPFLYFAAIVRSCRKDNGCAKRCAFFIFQFFFADFCCQYAVSRFAFYAETYRVAGLPLRAYGGFRTACHC